ncbi:MAG: YggS family pyridoxal phosphate-dependent enzyme [Gemmataceae bacterium]|nr:YggS family pyridoxal phosphate-dependent enzyme [Gemmataceae bacterium]
MEMEKHQSLLQSNLEQVEGRIALACARSGRPRQAVTLVAVTKTVSVQVAELLPGLGLVDLAENRPQELWKKAEAIPQARWHFIGHLQRNKIERTLPLVALFHSIDSLRLLDAVGSWSMKNKASQAAFIEVNISGEESKQGFSPKDLLASAERFARLKGINLLGLMGMAGYETPGEKARPAFQLLRQTRDQLQLLTGLGLPFLSMGMSNDFETAIEEGATHIRLGSVLFQGVEKV